jgi:hypothetical protein
MSMNDRKPMAESSDGVAPEPRTKSPAPSPIDLDADDGWKIPLGPIDEIEGRAEAVPEPVPVGHGGGLFHRLSHRG